MKTLGTTIAAAGTLLLSLPVWGQAQTQDQGVLEGGGAMEGVTGDGTALQQQTVAPEQLDVSRFQELRSRDYVVKPYNLTLRQLEDADVYGEDGNQIGEVQRFLGDDMNNVIAVTVETEGFLGIGGEDVVVPLDQLQLVGDRFVTALTEDQLEAMPRWRD